ncbi:uncharacterized protein LOC111242779 [Vigna radiata var. radiata]|uniref:Uncharacterized protein LOC111242779 n=1 Tax=Vigna radiata var. radiata TaxID=3916 RepID=A0A3Q0FGX0_VIGRR|nr:uncharacterized protein LOC111242779 [Vigna radiata var. radiata]
MCATGRWVCGGVAACSVVVLRFFLGLREEDVGVAAACSSKLLAHNICGVFALNLMLARFGTSTREVFLSAFSSKAKDGIQNLNWNQFLQLDCHGSQLPLRELRSLCHVGKGRRRWWFGIGEGIATLGLTGTGVE